MRQVYRNRIGPEKVCANAHGEGGSEEWAQSRYVSSGTEMGCSRGDKYV